MKESAVVTPVLKWWRGKGFLALKLSDRSTAGQPDWLFIGPDSGHAFIEFKAPGERPTALQEKWISDLRALGHKAEWFDASNPAMAWLKKELLQ